LSGHPQPSSATTQGLHAASGWAPVNMATQGCNHQTWVRDTLGLCVYLSKCVPQKT